MPQPVTIFLFLFLVLAGCNSAHGRTVALVYDDSGSMLQQNGWSYANYAVQVLVAFLDVGDTFYVVRMNSGKGVETLPFAGGRRRSVLHTITRWKKPVNGNGTPYSAVRAAADIFLQGRNRAPEPMGEQHSDWLIVVTDGKLADAKNQSAAGEASADARRFFSSPVGGSTRVAFLLIGNKADPQVAAMWKKYGGQQVEIIRTTPSNLVDSMGEIVAMIAGRDRKFHVTVAGREVHFSSIFPVKRITVFMQGAARSLADLEEVVLPDNSDHVAMEKLDVYLPHFAGSGGRITHLTRKGAMPAGDVILRFDRDVQEKDLQLFVEPAIDFTVALRYARDGTPVSGTPKGEYGLCQGEEVFFTVSFKEFRNGRTVDLAITPEIARRLRLTGHMPTGNIAFTYDRAAGMYRTRPWKARKGNTKLGMEATYPGYFHLKSNLVTLEGRNCEKQAELSSDNPVISVEYTDSASFVARGSFSLVRRGDAYRGSTFLNVAGLPRGVALEIAGQRLSEARQRVQVPLELDRPLPVTILTNATFHPGKDVTFSLELTTDNTYVKKTSPLNITLRLKPRKLALVPAAGQWRASFEQLGRVEGPLFAMTINGRKISPDRTGEFTIAVSTDKRIGLTIEPVPGTSSFRVRVRPALLSCLTDTGRIPMKLTMKSPVPGESITSQFYLVVDDTDWWTRCHRMVFVLAAILLFLAYVVALTKKRRFARDGIVIYERQYRQLRIEPRPERYYLAGWRAEDDGSRVLNFLCRWLLPIVPERRSVRGMTLEAGQSAHVIILPPDQQRANMTIGLTPLDNPGARPEPISLRTALEVKGDRQIERYTYDKT